MMPASSNSLTVRYTVEIEMFLSTPAQRLYSSSTSGWSSESASTRAITRRCSVMRIPLDVQRASMLVLGAVTNSSWVPIIRLRVKAVHCVNSSEVAPQHQCGRGVVAALLVVAGPPANLAEAGPPIEPPCWFVVLVDFEEHRVRAKSGEPPQMQIEQRTGEPAAAAGGCNRDRKDFRFAAREPRQDEAMQRAAQHRAMSNEVALSEHSLELAITAAVAERVGVQLCDGRGVARVCLRERRLAAREQARQHPDHRRGSLAASWGCASGARR